MFTPLSSGGILAGIVGKFSIQNMSDFVPFFGIRDGFFETVCGRVGTWLLVTTTASLLSGVEIAPTDRVLLPIFWVLFPSKE